MPASILPAISLAVVAPFSLFPPPLLQPLARHSVSCRSVTHRVICFAFSQPHRLHFTSHLKISVFPPIICLLSFQQLSLLHFIACPSPFPEICPPFLQPIFLHSAPQQQSAFSMSIQRPFCMLSASPHAGNLSAVLTAVFLQIKLSSSFASSLPTSFDAIHELPRFLSPIYP